MTSQSIGDSVGRPHIAHADAPEGVCQIDKRSISTAIWERGKAVMCAERALSVDDTIDAIHQADGKAFIAHPHLLTSSFPVDLLLQRPFDGIECRYGKISTDKPWAQIARDKQLAHQRRLRFSRLSQARSSHWAAKGSINQLLNASSREPHEHRNTSSGAIFKIKAANP
jgi:predicted metal-dependent phosphoesterase TrpH